MSTKTIGKMIFSTLAHPNLAVVGRVAPNFTTAKLRLCRNVRYTNTHVLIDKQGKIVRVVPGDLRESDLKNLIET